VISAWCDEATDGGGWTIVSIDGDLANDTCRFRLKNDAPGCGGGTPSPTIDWQMPGTQQSQLIVTQILLLDYTLDMNNQPVFAAGTALSIDTGDTSSGAFTVTPYALGNNQPLSCDLGLSPLANRTKVGVHTNGYTVWGEPDATCAQTGGVSNNFGLNVLTVNSIHYASGWDSDTDAAAGSCGCYPFTPVSAESTRGYIGVR
jgi:hypothetical protein